MADQRGPWGRPSLARLGASAFDAVRTSGELGLLVGQTLRALLVDRQRWRVQIIQCYRIGYRSLPVVVLSGLSIGLVLAFQMDVALGVFAAETMSGAMVHYGIFTQLAPVITGLMLAGRVGSSIAAELGTMQVTEQIDALRTMGTDPIAHLVAPRFLACVLLMPFLTAISALVGVYGAAWLSVEVLGIEAAPYWQRAMDFNTWWEVFVGLIKPLFFGAIIAIVACHRGLKTVGGATGVGEACTKGVVSSSVHILLANFFLTVVLQRLRPWIMALVA